MLNFEANNQVRQKQHSDIIVWWNDHRLEAVGRSHSRLQVGYANFKTLPDMRLIGGWGLLILHRCNLHFNKVPDEYELGSVVHWDSRIPIAPKVLSEGRRVPVNEAGPSFPPAGCCRPDGMTSIING